MDSVYHKKMPLHKIISKGFTFSAGICILVKERQTIVER